MTAMPHSSAPVVPMTAAEYAALPEDEEIHYELQEGVLVPMASPTPEHQLALAELIAQMRVTLPEDLRTVYDVDVDIDLQIVPAHRPGFVRRPDISVVTRAGVARRRAEGGILNASELVLAVELVSVDSERTDHVIKRGEYADAGVAHYWIVEIDDGPSLVAHHLAGEFGYVPRRPSRAPSPRTSPSPSAWRSTSSRRPDRATPGPWAGYHDRPSAS